MTVAVRPMRSYGLIVMMALGGVGATDRAQALARYRAIIAASPVFVTAVHLLQQPDLTGFADPRPEKGGISAGLVGQRKASFTDTLVPRDLSMYGFCEFAQGLASPFKEVAYLGESLRLVVGKVAALGQSLPGVRRLQIKTLGTWLPC